jgi:hypothetical protein
MAKIKSTLDLIMEKTGHLSMNSEEKEALKREERLRKVRGAVTLFLTGDKDQKFLLQELDRLWEVPAEEQDENRQLCLDLLRDALTPLADNSRALLGLEKVAGAEERSLWEERLRDWEASFEKTRPERLAAVSSRLRESLADQAGLSGPALEPCSEGSPLWE